MFQGSSPVSFIIAVVPGQFDEASSRRRWAQVYIIRQFIQEGKSPAEFVRGQEAILLELVKTFQGPPLAVFKLC